jgi:hypothetical protein
MREIESYEALVLFTSACDREKYEKLQKKWKTKIASPQNDAKY